MVLSFLFGESKEKLLNKQKKLSKDISKCMKRMCDSREKIRKINDLIREADSITERNKLREKRDKLKLDENNYSCAFKKCKDNYINKINNDIKLYDNYLKKNFGEKQLEYLNKLKKIVNKGITKTNITKAIKYHDNLCKYTSMLMKKKERKEKEKETKKTKSYRPVFKLSST